MLQLEHAVQILERTPRVLRSRLDNLDEFWTHRNYGEGTWSAYEVVGHLIIAERDDWMPRVRRIVEHGESLAFDPFPHDAAIRPAAGPPLVELLSEFSSRRQANLTELQAMHLTPADLSRTGKHPALGRVTLSQLIATWAAHDLHHLRQIELAMAWQLRDDVGPWRAYLNTLAPRP